MNRNSINKVSEDPKKYLRDWFVRKYGPIGVLLLMLLSAAVWVWWNWAAIENRPGVEKLMSLLPQAPLPKARAGVFVIAVARFERDKNGESERLVVEALRDFPGVQVLQFDRTNVIRPSASGEDPVLEAHNRARRLLVESGADVLIWGSVLRDDNRSRIKLYWTTSTPDVPVIRAQRIGFTKDLDLPPVFWGDLTLLLRAIMETRDEKIRASQKNRIAESIKPYTEQIRTLLISLDKEKWNRGAVRDLWVMYANAVSAIADEETDSQKLAQDLDEVLTANRLAVSLTDKRLDPKGWIIAQNNLGNALFAKGDTEEGSESLQLAMTAYREALTTASDILQDKQLAAVPENNMANALRALGDRDENESRVKYAEAVDGYRMALETWTRDHDPRLWALAQNNLCVALARLGQDLRRSETVVSAKTACEASLEELSREHLPINWAETQVNLGNIVVMLGVLETQDKERRNGYMLEAASHFKEALGECSREREPRCWVGVKMGFGSIYYHLSAPSHSVDGLNSAIVDFKEAADVSTSIGDFRGAEIAKGFLRCALLSLPINLRPGPPNNPDVAICGSSLL